MQVARSWGTCAPYCFHPFCPDPSGETAPPTRARPTVVSPPVVASATAPVRRLVLDVIEPDEPPLVAVAGRVSELDGCEAVSGSPIELDQQVQNVKLTVEGSAVDLSAVRERVEELGGTVHTVDRVVCGERVIEDCPTPQDG